MASKLEGWTGRELQGDRYTRQVLSLPCAEDDVLKVNAGLTINLVLLPSNLVLDAIPPQCCQVKSILNSQSRMYTDQSGMKRPDGNEHFYDIGAYEDMDPPT